LVWLEEGGGGRREDMPHNAGEEETGRKKRGAERGDRVGNGFLSLLYIARLLLLKQPFFLNEAKALTFIYYFPPS
jgi:hypothetical protein